MYGSCSLVWGLCICAGCLPPAHLQCPQVLLALLPPATALSANRRTPETCGLLQVGHMYSHRLAAVSEASCWLGVIHPCEHASRCCCLSSSYDQACCCCRQASLGLACRLLLSRQFQPRVGRLAAVKSREALQHRLLTSAHEQAAAAASVGATVVPLDEEQSARVAHSSHKPPQKAASERNVTDRRLFQAIDLLKPLLAEAEGHDSSEHPATSGSTAPSGPNAV